MALTLTLVLATAGVAAWWWSRSRVIEAGSAVIAIEGRPLSPSRGEVGIGIGGTLGLVNDRCVGFVGEDESQVAVIVWPVDTQVSGSGEDLTITSEGKTVRVGDDIEGGSAQRTHFPEFDGRLPDACRGFPLIDVGLSS